MLWRRQCDILYVVVLRRQHLSQRSLDAGGLPQKRNPTTNHDGERRFSIFFLSETLLGESGGDLYAHLPRSWPFHFASKEFVTDGDS